LGTFRSQSPQQKPHIGTNTHAAKGNDEQRKRRHVTVATEKQIKANKENARKSTGPVTETGKAASSRNAVSHGLTAERHFLEGEDPAQFAQLRTAVVDYWKPVTPMEIFLVDRITALMWRLLRVPVYETAVLSALAEPRQVAHSAPADEGARQKREQPGASRERIFSSPLTLAQALEVAFTKSFFDKINRYEAALDTQLRRASSDLRDLIYVRAQQTLAEALAKREQLPPPAPTANASEAFSQIKLG
jgi:hypothetical protein